MKQSTIKRLIEYYYYNKVNLIRTDNLYCIWNKGTPQEIDVIYIDLDTFISDRELSIK